MLLTTRAAPTSLLSVPASQRPPPDSPGGALERQMLLPSVDSALTEAPPGPEVVPAPEGNIWLLRQGQGECWEMRKPETPHPSSVGRSTKESFLEVVPKLKL